MATSLNGMPTIEAKLVQEFRELTGQAFAELRTPLSDAGLRQGQRQFQVDLLGRPDRSSQHNESTTSRGETTSH